MVDGVRAGSAPRGGLRQRVKSCLSSSSTITAPVLAGVIAISPAGPARADQCTVNGGAPITSGDVSYPGGDTVLCTDTGSSIFGGIDGGTGQDLLRLDGDLGSDTFDLTSSANIETLAKEGAGTWTLTGAGAIGSLFVSEGILEIAGTLDVTSTASATFAAGTTTNITGTVNEAGTTTVQGTLNILMGGDYNAEFTQIDGGGLIDVMNGGTYDGTNGIVLDGGVLRTRAGGAVNAMGDLLGNALNDFVDNAGTIDVAGMFDLGGGIDLVVNSGSLTGTAANLGDGNDTFVQFIGATFAGTIDGGSGRDTLVLDGTTGSDTFDLATIANFEGLIQQNTGTWTVTGTQTFSEFVRVLGGTLNVGNAATANIDTSLIALGSSLLGGANILIEENSRLAGTDFFGDTVGNVQDITVGGTFDITNVALLFGGADRLSLTATGTMNVGTFRMGDGADFAQLDGAFNGNLNMGGGDDQVILRGTLTGNVDLGTGNDLFEHFIGATFAGTIDGGSGQDLLRLDGDLGSDTFDLTSSANIETLAKEGAGTWTLTGTGAIGSLFVSEGILEIAGTLDITSTASATFAAGTTTNITGTVNEAGTTTVQGTLNILMGGDYNAEFTQIDGGGLIDVMNGGTYDGTNGIVLDGGVLRTRAGGAVNAMGDLLGNALNDFVNNAGTIDVAGMFNLGGGNDFVNNTGTIDVAGMFNLGGGEDLVANRGSLTVTAANLGDGNDTFLQIIGATFAGTIDGGSGQDTLVLGGTTGSDTFDLATIANFESLVKIGPGTWTVIGNKSFPLEILLGAGTLTVGNGAPSNLTTSNEIVLGDVLTLNVTLNVNSLSQLGGTLLRGAANSQTVNVSGTVSLSTGAFFGSDADQLVVNAGGVFNGAISLGPGNDIFTVHAGGSANGDVDPGDGDDLITISGTLRGDIAPSAGNDIVIVNGVLNGNADGGGQAGDMISFNTGGNFGGNFTNWQTANLNPGAGNTLTLGSANQAVTSNIQSGRVRLTGSLAGIVNVAGGATLEGTGQTATVNNFGTTAPGAAAGAQIATLNITGDFNQQAGGIYEVQIGPGLAADLLQVGGAANLVGNGALNITALPGTITPGIYTLIDATGGVNGTFGIENITLPGLIFSLMYNPNTVSLNVGISPRGILSALPDLTPNQTSTLQFIGENQIVLFDLAFALSRLPLGRIPNVLDQLHPELFDSQVTATIELAQQTGRAIDNRLLQLWLGLIGVPGGQDAYGPDGARLLADVSGIAGIHTPGGRPVTVEPGLVSLWATGLGGYSKTGPDSPHLGYDYTHGGALVGADIGVSENAVVGIVLGGTTTDIDFTGRMGTASADGFTVGAYTGWMGERLFVNGSANYGHNWYETSRPIAFGTINRTAAAKATGHHLAGHVRGGARFPVAGWTVEPSASLDYVRLRQNAFTETGAGSLNLAVRSRDVDSLRAETSIRLVREIRLSETATLVPEMHVGYAHEFLDNDRRIDASFGGIASQFRVDGDRPDRNVATYGAGVRLDMRYGISVYASYRGEIGANRQAHSAQVGARVSW